MPDAADLSRLLYAPIAVTAYVTAIAAYGWAMTSAEDATATGRAWPLWIARATAAVGIASHAGHLVARGLASGGRVPWGTMFEYASVLALAVAVTSVVVVDLRLHRPAAATFGLLASVLWMGVAMATFGEPGPLQPILNSSWLVIHVFTMMLSFAILTVAFASNGLFLLRDRAERALAAATPQPRSLSAAANVSLPAADVAEAGPRPVTLRQHVRPLPAAATMGLVGVGLALVVSGPALAPAYAAGGIGAVVLGWWAVPQLPEAADLESLTYRITVFAFPILTFGILSGAIWAEQSWGRYWGWDPKETSAFLTWVVFAAYLHAKATRGMRGRKAAYVLTAGYVVLLFTFYVVNLLIVGLHSYASL